MRVLVTGGGGFLGHAVIAELARRGHAPESASRGHHPELEADGVRVHRLDLSDAAAVMETVQGYEGIVHCAAKTGVWGARADFVRANVDGTKNLLEACLVHGIERFVLASSPSVVFDGKGHRDAGNGLPYPERFLSPYPESKAIAERMTLRANGKGTLATCALRPHLIFGPGDPHLVPRLIERARAGRLAVVGDGENEVSLTHVDNAAAAHVDALEALAPGAPCAGRAYFVCQAEPVRLWEWIAHLLERLGESPPRRRVSHRVAYAGGAACELLWNALRLRGEPPMTRFVALQLSTDHSYDLGPAMRDFGYRERIDMEHATESVIASLSADRPARDASG